MRRSVTYATSIIGTVMVKSYIRPILNETEDIRYRRIRNSRMRIINVEGVNTYMDPVTVDIYVTYILRRMSVNTSIRTKIV